MAILSSFSLGLFALLFYLDRTCCPSSREASKGRRWCLLHTLFCQDRLYHPVVFHEWMTIVYLALQKFLESSGGQKYILLFYAIRAVQSLCLKNVDNARVDLTRFWGISVLLDEHREPDFLDLIFT